LNAAGERERAALDGLLLPVLLELSAAYRRFCCCGVRMKCDNGFSVDVILTDSSGRDGRHK